MHFCKGFHVQRLSAWHFLLFKSVSVSISFDGTAVVCRILVRTTAGFSSRLSYDKSSLFVSMSELFVLGLDCRAEKLDRLVWLGVVFGKTVLQSSMGVSGRRRSSNKIDPSGVIDLVCWMLTRSRLQHIRV